MLERKILAQLENPNIASLIDGGSTPDGLPYLVMEYIEGEPITKFCDSHQFSIEERLELFRKVCAAVSYAHQNLIIHRDIKPSNILVTTDGTPKLLDFGIAKLLHPEWSLEKDEATATMFRLMTPEYASPEQIRGLPITTASDVYSLGVVLYELLSGERPYKIESRLPQEVANIVLSEEPVRPSSVVLRPSFEQTKSTSPNEQKTKDKGQRTKDKGQINNPKSQIPNPKLLRGDLDNIILKALRKEPERRYQSVQEFSEDIRRHLAGLPVTATADTTFYRIGKFIKRHRIGVLVSILFALTLLSATFVTTWQSIVAKRERAKAENHFNQVRKLANTVLFDYHDEVAKLSGSTPLREKMVKDALEYLDNLSAENIADKSLQLELANAYEKVGDVQGNPYSANLGNKDGALESYRKSFVIRQTLLTSEPENIQMRTDSARSFERIGDILWAKGQSDEAQANYRQALEIYLKLMQEKNLSDISSPQRLYNRIGQTQEQAGNFDGALESYQAALKESEDLVAGEPSNVKYRRALSIGYAKIGDVYYQKHDFKKASENYQQALPILQKLSADEPINQTLSRSLALICARIALTEMEAGNYLEAITKGQQAIAIEREISVADSNNIQIQNDLSDTLANLGETYGRMGNLALSTKTFAEAILISKQFLAKNSDYALARSNFVNTYLTFAKILLKNGKTEQALENFRQALTIFDPAKNELSAELAEIYQGIGAAHQKSSHFQEAKTWYQKSIDVWNNLREKGKLSSDDLSKVDEISKLIEKCSSRLK